MQPATLLRLPTVNTCRTSAWPITFSRDSGSSRPVMASRTSSSSS